MTPFLLAVAALVALAIYTLQLRKRLMSSLASLQSAVALSASLANQVVALRGTTVVGTTDADIDAVTAAVSAVNAVLQAAIPVAQIVSAPPVVSSPPASPAP